jgi:hypothetical protein
MSVRTVAGPYALKQWEDGSTYYLVGGPQPDSGGGAVNGAVIRLGWDARHVVAQRAATAGGDTAWVVIDVDTRRASHPMTDAELASREDLARLTTYRADSAWARLR